MSEIDTAQVISPNEEPKETGIFQEATFGEEETQEKQIQQPAPKEQEGQKPEESKNMDEDFSRKFAALSRKERELQEFHKQVKKQKEEFEKEKAELERRKQLKKADPVKYLEQEEINLEDLLFSVAKQGDAETAEEKIARLEKQYQDYIKQQEEKERKKQLEEEERVAKQQLDTAKKYIKDQILENPDDYELIIGLDDDESAFEYIYQIAVDEFNKTGETPNIKEIGKKVEAFLRKKYEKALGFKAFSSKLAPKVDESKKTDESPKVTTLSGSLGPASSAPSQKYKSLDESKAEAAKLIRWT